MFYFENLDTRFSVWIPMRLRNPGIHNGFQEKIPISHPVRSSVSCHCQLDRITMVKI